MLGYATHALLDSCTTYGTMLFWPFSDVRIAWNTVSIIDPLFTGPILALVVLAAKKKREFYGRLAVLWALCTHARQPSATKLRRWGATVVARDGAGRCAARWLCRPPLTIGVDVPDASVSPMISSDRRLDRL